MGNQYESGNTYYYRRSSGAGDAAVPSGAAPSGAEPGLGSGSYASGSSGSSAKGVKGLFKNLQKGTAQLSKKAVKIAKTGGRQARSVAALVPCCCMTLDLH